jgi:lipopolysaccharide export system permease protein
MCMHQIDRYILRSFAGPFVLTFFITLFILLMQFLWKYIDDLVGKGLDWYLVAELMFYASATMVPLALPLATLLAALMTFGNLGERFELAALKSSGISMFRFMRSTILAALLVTLGAYGFSNYVLPKASLKFWTRLIDITQKKPALNIKPSVFYHDIENFAILIRDKEEDNIHVHDIIIYDKTSRGEVDNLLVAEQAQMYSDEQNNALVMRLFQGRQYQRLQSSGDSRETGQEYMRMEFGKWERALDLSGLDMSSTNEQLYKNHYRMLTQRQLAEASDSIRRQTERRFGTLTPVISSYFWFERSPGYLDSLQSVQTAAPLLDSIPPEHRSGALNRALVSARNVQAFSRQIQDNTRYGEDRIRQHRIEWQRKMSLSAACLVFLFVGAPLGAIIRKGGFGMPVVTSVLIFVIFYVLYITGEKFAAEGVWGTGFGMWFANLLIFPFSLWLTRKAMNDSPLLNTEAWREALGRLRGKGRPKQPLP